MLLVVFEDRIRAIVDRVEALRKRTDTADWFGVYKHQFRLNPPLPQAEVEAFESLHAISLPEDYRQFLLLAGNGGAGPYYGVAPLSEWDYWFEMVDGCTDLLASPCPFVDEQTISPEWSEQLPREREDWYRGSMHICDQGCTYVARLVVTGPSRGRVFNLDIQVNGTPSFAKDASFIDWYERWLDQAQVGEPPPWFGLDKPAYSKTG